MFTHSYIPKDSTLFKNFPSQERLLEIKNFHLPQKIEDRLKEEFLFEIWFVEEKDEITKSLNQEE